MSLVVNNLMSNSKSSSNLSKTSLIHKNKLPLMDNHTHRVQNNFDQEFNVSSQ